ncbi:MAG: DUF3429 domain-containing protein [Parvularculaceae bacterium]|nr:DUF3429 domain-containing protein [Parvularculaceae bacterium]
MSDRQTSFGEMGLLAMSPFILCFMAVWSSPLILPGSVAYDFREFSLFYASIVASFFAGFNANAVIFKGSGSGESVLPGLVGASVAWIGALPVGAFGIAMPNVARFLLVIGALIFLLLRDLRAVSIGLLPPWYGPLRMRLTFWACISLILIGSRLLLRI